uniref:Putative sarm protein with sterile alpha and armadillo motifs n=2 Tax=Rhodnius TaxID=13248 RepID=R4G818_RHOPR
MVEETSYASSKPKSRAARPKPVYLWTVQDVQKWLKRHCSDYYPLYADKFSQHEITGRTLVRVNEGTLLRIGVDNPDHRQEFWREITKLRLKSDILEIRDLERKESGLV